MILSRVGMSHVHLRGNFVEVGEEKQEAKKQFRMLALEIGVDADSEPKERLAEK